VGRRFNFSERRKLAAWNLGEIEPATHLTAPTNGGREHTMACPGLPIANTGPRGGTGKRCRDRPASRRRVSRACPPGAVPNLCVVATGCPDQDRERLAETQQRTRSGRNLGDIGADELEQTDRKTTVLAGPDHRYPMALDLDDARDAPPPKLRGVAEPGERPDACDPTTLKVAVWCRWWSVDRRSAGPLQYRRDFRARARSRFVPVSPFAPSTGGRGTPYRCRAAAYRALQAGGAACRRHDMEPRPSRGQRARPASISPRFSSTSAVSLRPGAAVRAFDRETRARGGKRGAAWAIGDATAPTVRAYPSTSRAMRSLSSSNMHRITRVGGASSTRSTRIAVSTARRAG